MVLFLAGILAAGTAHSIEISVLGRAKGLPSDWVRALASEDGKIWVGTRDGGVAVWEPARSLVRDFSGEYQFASREITSIAPFDGKVYVGTTLGLMVFDGGTWARLENAGNVTMRNVVLAASPNGKELWAGSMTLTGGTVKFDGERWIFMGGEGRGLFNDIDSFAFGPDGTWMGSLSGTVYLHRGGEGVDYFPEGLSGNVSSLARMGEDLFAGTSEGLFRMEGKKWTSVPFPAEWGKTAVLSMDEEDGQLYLGTSAGLARLKGGRMDRLTKKDGLPADRVEAVLAQGDSVYAGTMKGLGVVRGW